MSYLVRVIASRTAYQEADVLVRVPDWLKAKSAEFNYYITDLVYDIANEEGLWEAIDYDHHSWDVAQAPFKND